MNPYPPWLNAGDNAWQLVAATLVGLMSIPGIAILYGGIVQRKWAVNTMLMAFTGFSLVLMVWVLWVFKMSFGSPLKLGPGILSNFVGIPGTILGRATQDQAQIPLLNGTMPQFRFPQSTLAYFQFVFARITPLLFLGSVIGRIKLQSLVDLCPAVVHAGLLGQRVPAVGRRLVVSARLAGLQRWLCDPPCRRDVRFRGGRGDRTASGARSGSGHPQ
jgi:hypothetical protein